MATTGRISLDKYPIELLNQILTHVRLENIIQLIPHHDFLTHNPNLQTAINDLITNSNISYNNRFIQYSFVHMYKRTETYLNKHDISFIDDSRVEELAEYCNRHNITNVVTISYYVWSLADLVEMMELIRKLPSSSGSPCLRYNLEIEIVPGFLYIFNLGVLLSEVANKMGWLIDTIMVYNYSGSFKFNSGDFVNLKVLWFEDSNIKFVNSLPDGLKSLYLFPNKFGWNNNSSISVNQKLPDGLTSLVFGNCTIGNIIAPGSLSSIQLEKVKDATEHYNFVRSAILTSLVNGKLQELKIDSIWNSRRMIANVPDLVFHDAEISKNLYKLTTLSVDGFLPNLTHCLNLKKLQISKITNATDFDNYKFPGSLEELALTYNNITNLFTIDKNITGTNLRVLNLADNPIHWSSYIPNFKRFNKLKSLKLSNTHIGSNFPKIKYPDSIEALSLEVNQITSLDGIEFPANLKNLGIGSNFISKIEYPHFPTTLETIHLTENKISKVDLSRNSRHESLKIEILYLNYCKLTKFNNVNISQYVKILNFDNCKLSTISNIGFPDTLLELSFSGCGLTSFENILWGDHPRLRYLNLSQNSLTKFDIRLPSSIQSINLSMNNLTQLSNSLLSHKDNLKVLNLSSNKFQRFIYSFNITNLQNLDLSFNSLKLINLTFPKYSHTRLKVLNLCSNKLSELHPVMIGHDKNLTMHTNLIEIDLTNNKIKPDDITKQIDKFPDSLLCFFIGHTGEQDRFGYDLAKNIINHEICTGKRIDIP